MDKPRITRFQPQVMDLLFIGYLVFFKDVLAERFAGTVFDNRASIALGAVLIAALVLEVFGIYYKTAQLGAQLNKNKPSFGNSGENSAPGPEVLIFWFLHMIVGVVLVMAAGTALTGREISENMPPIVMVLIFAEVIRNIAILVTLSGMEDYKEEISPAKNLFADFALLFFNIVAYTGTWGVLVVQKGMTITGENAAVTAVYTFCAALIFLIFYLPINMMYFFEQSTTAKTLPEQAAAYITTAIVMIFALLPLY